MRLVNLCMTLCFSPCRDHHRVRSRLPLGWALLSLPSLTGSPGLYFTLFCTGVNIETAQQIPTCARVRNEPCLAAFSSQDTRWRMARPPERPVPPLTALYCYAPCIMHMHATDANAVAKHIPPLPSPVDHPARSANIPNMGRLPVRAQNIIHACQPHGTAVTGVLMPQQSQPGPATEVEFDG